MNETHENNTQYGYLIIKVSTARGAIPLSGASVTIRGGEKDISGVLFSLLSNRDGQTEKVELPAPNRNLSEEPGNIKPYATYSVDVFKEGYSPLFFEQVAVFPSVLSIQPAVMIPLASGKTESDFPPTPPNLTGPSGNLL